MNFSDFCESLEDPLYIDEEKVQCKKGFKYDKDLGKCVPVANLKTTKTQNEDQKELPDPLMGFNTWGATGLNGDGYALAVEEETEKDWPSIKDAKKSKKTKVKYDPHMKVHAPTIKEMTNLSDRDLRELEKKEALHKAQDDRMRYGKSGKPPETPLRKGEVKRWNKLTKKWVSNKD